MVRLGLCCTFLEQPIKFRTTTARYLLTRRPSERPHLLNELALHNARALADAIRWCAAHGIGAFRVPSGILPMYTHPVVGWQLAERGAGAGVALALRAARQTAIRLSFHPDQFVVPGSVSPAVVASSLAELEYQASVAELIGAEQLTIHGGGAQGGKAASLERLATNLRHLSPRARRRIVLENDDRVFTVEDLLPICERLDVPLVYDVHHHRCNPDRLDVERATELAAATWNGREPWAHLSSPALGWKGRDPRPHADYIKVTDVPACWLGRTMTIDVEAKAKELAVLRLGRWLARARSGAAPRSPRTARPGRCGGSAATAG
jgi:UV DNA damage endonuclease